MLLLDQAQGWRTVEKSSLELFVLLWLKAACAVNKHAVRFQQWNHRTSDFDLLLLHAIEIGRS